jgi:hypothetical protein
MAKEQKESAPAPMLIFSEAEVLRVVDFINYVYKNAVFNQSMEAAGKCREMFNDMHKHVQKIEGYILEHKKTTQIKKAE